MYSDDLARVTPYLRRYARALTGSQTYGDTLVGVALRSLVDTTLRDEGGAHVGLFAAFHRLWLDKGAPAGPEGALQTMIDARLGRLEPERRAALLLVSMEGFSLRDAGLILRLSASDVEDRLDAAADDIERQLATDVLIIEDEPIVALDLERLLGDLGHRVVAVTATREEAAAAAADRSLGLVLADVRLADGSSGLDAASDILQRFDIPVIFITAFPERLLTGHGREPTFLVTKPFREETVKALIGQALFFHQPSARPRDQEPVAG